MKILANYHDTTFDKEGNAIVSFKVKSYQYKQLLEELEEEKLYALETREIKTARSIKQNNYLWKLIREIDIAENGKPTDDYDIYVKLLELANVKYEYLIIVPEAEQGLKQAFRAIKFVKDYDVNGKKCKIFKCFIGSSKFNKDEMRLLIDKALDVASYLGINTTFYEDVLR